MSANPDFICARAFAGFDPQFAEALQGAIITAIGEASIVSDARVMAIRTSETIEALLVVLAQVIAISDLARSPTSLRKGLDEIARKLRQHTTRAAAGSHVQDFRRRCFRTGNVEGHA
jgi:low affinity Fe/Cu permease